MISLMCPYLPHAFHSETTLNGKRGDTDAYMPFSFVTIGFGAWGGVVVKALRY